VDVKKQEKQLLELEAANAARSLKGEAEERKEDRNFTANNKQ